MVKARQGNPHDDAAKVWIDTSALSTPQFADVVAAAPEYVEPPDPVQELYDALAAGDTWDEGKAALLGSTPGAIAAVGARAKSAK